MLHSPVTIPIVFVRGMLSGIRARGIATERYLEDAGIAPALLNEAASGVTAEQYVTLLRLLMERLDDEALGFLSRPLRLGSFALIVRSALGAPSLGAALHRMARTSRLLQDDVELVCLRDGPLAGVGFAFAREATGHQNFLHELLLRVFWRILAWLHGSRLTPSRFDFAFELPAYTASYAKVFPGVLQFGQAHSAFWIDGTLLATPVRRDEPALQAFLRAAPGNVILPRLSEQAVSGRVRKLLQQARPEWPDLARTAQALHMSASTLQRHLAAEGTSFQSLKDQLRCNLAIMRLNTSTVPLAALAAELGFADSAAFQRAFKSWTGSPPGSYRRDRSR